MWDSISIIISIFASIFIAIVFWNLQKNTPNLNAQLIRKLFISSLSGSLFGFIIYAALNPNQSFNPFTVDPAEQLTSTEEKSNDSSSFKSANGSLKFYLDDPCNN
jgi:hypothetical protein